MPVDLHLHSSASDGLLSPRALMRKCADAGLEIVALTDHDTLSGVRDAMDEGKKIGMKVIAGVELSTGGAQELHILGYGIKDIDKMEEMLKGMRGARRQRLYRIAERLKEAGIVIDAQSIEREAGDAVGRPHVARALMAAGYASGMQEAFQRYLIPGKIGYVPREKLAAEEAVRIIRTSGGIAVLAHPCISIHDNFTLPERIKALQRTGLKGVEAHHPRHTPTQRRMLDKMARNLGLFVTGGSDFHGTAEGMPGCGMDEWTEKDRDVAKLLRVIEE